jgi:HD-GYP domain-containing protein (c-di-GMP phosphodiesterase class II)
MNDGAVTLESPAAIAGRLVDQLVAALVNARIYAPSHPRVQASFAAVQRHVRDLAELWRENPVRIGAVDGLLFFQQRPLLSASLASARLIGQLQKLGAGGLELAAEATHRELGELFAALGGAPVPGETYAHVNQRLCERQCRGALLLPPYADPKAAAEAEPASASRVRVAVNSFQGVIDLLQDVTVSVCRGGTIDFGPVRAQAEQVLDHLRIDDGPLLNLTRRGQYDAFTFGHSVRTTVLALNLARTLTDDRELLTRIGCACLLHDVGKALVPFELLHAQRPLGADELALVRLHPQLGAEILLDHQDRDPLAVAAAFGHHTGSDDCYPCTLHEHPVSLTTEIVKICDIYEALTAARPHRQPMSPVRAYRVMLAMEGRFDRGLLRRFVDSNGLYPIGQKVVLQSGEIAVVRRQGSVATAPVVELITDGDGALLDPGDRQLVDLGAEAGGALRMVVGEVPSASDTSLVMH